MPPDRASALTSAAQRKRSDTLARAQAALSELNEQGRPITFQAVARRAAVSRQWLYEQTDLRAEIERLRARHLERRGEVPARDRSTEASLRQRIETLLADNRRLREHVADLKAELALAYGAQRAAHH